MIYAIDTTRISRCLVGEIKNSSKMRVSNTTKFGFKFNADTVNLVWNKGQLVFGYDPSQVRKDNCGALIYYSQYGNTNSPYGWEIDHVCPVSRGGTDALSNLQPLQWENNRHKSDNWPIWSCKYKAA